MTYPVAALAAVAAADNAKEDDGAANPDDNVDQSNGGCYNNHFFTTRSRCELYIHPPLPDVCICKCARMGVWFQHRRS